MSDVEHASCVRADKGNGDNFDLVVIGAGSAGFSASITAAELGARVALVGHGTIGGTCVNVGCVPSKTMIRAAETFHQAATAARFAGIHGQARLDDWRALVTQKDELVAELRQAKYIDLLPSYNNVAYLEGAARLTGGGVAMNGSLLRSAKVVVATGSSPAVPPIPGIESVPYLTSTTALELERLPASLLVIGGGYIGCELAQMFARAGVEVTLVCRSRLVPETEPEISAALAGYFRDEGITVRDGISYEIIRRTERGVGLSIGMNGSVETIEAERVLVGTGRRPNTAGLGLRDVGIELTENGGIRVDDHLQTTNPDIYAAGDVTGRHQFVYMAAYGAKLAAGNAVNGNNRRYDAAAMPSVISRHPGDIRSLQNAQETVEAMKAGHPLIAQGVLQDTASRTYGAPDFPVRSDVLNELFPGTCPEEEVGISAPGLQADSYHYRVVDVKFTTLDLNEVDCKAMAGELC